MTDKPLDGKSALITGASRGIGRAIALAFARAGCDVAINYVNVPDRDNAAEAGQVADEIRLGSGAFCVELTSPTWTPEEMAAAVIDRFGKLDILVNNAGITADSTLKKLSKDAWDRVLAVNLTGAFHCCRAVIEHMRERQSGRVISLASVVALSGNIGQANYAASKAGLIGFTKSLAREVARRNITVNAIAPGFINTEMVQAMPAPALEQTLASIPMGRLGEAEEIADAAVFLASDAAKYITGHVLSVNGGLYM